MSCDSLTCVGKVSGKPLKEFDSEQEASDAADYARSSYNNNLLPYRCGRCNKWHLSPAERQTPSEKCGFCVGSDGRPKDTYRTEEDARRRASIICKEKGLYLRPYPCECGSGWHLTKS